LEWSCWHHWSIRSSMDRCGKMILKRSTDHWMITNGSLQDHQGSLQDHLLITEWSPMDRFRIIRDRFRIIRDRFRIIRDRFRIIRDRFRIIYWSLNDHQWIDVWENDPDAIRWWSWSDPLPLLHVLAATRTTIFNAENLGLFYFVQHSTEVCILVMNWM
jgi:hypothetical protein